MGDLAQAFKLFLRPLNSVVDLIKREHVQTFDGHAFIVYRWF
jgi:hypothetical protein